MRAGVLVAVVGPSGAGKDTLMLAARAALEGDGRFRFVRRVITRPADPDGENHLPVTRAEFERQREAGAFALWWEAHGLFYGLPRPAVEDALDAGCAAVANLSRRALPEAATRFPLRVLEITAPAEVLAARLAGRGREGADEVARRLAREVPLPPGLPAERVLNASSVEEGAARVHAALLRAAPAVQGEPRGA